jgi:hypothetical protein
MNVMIVDAGGIREFTVGPPVERTFFILAGNIVVVPGVIRF